MIDDTYVIFSKESSFNENKTELNETSIAFVSQKGNEKMYIAGNTFDFVPSGGSVGQILKRGTNNFYWDAPNKLYSSQIGLSNLRNEFSIYIVSLITSEYELKLISSLEKGETITAYCKNNYTDDSTITINESQFISLSSEYKFVVSPNKWIIIKILSNGNNYYVEIYKPDESTENIELNSNWDAKEGEPGYILNRPFYSNGIKEDYKEIINKIITLQLADSQPEDNSGIYYVKPLFFGNNALDYFGSLGDEMDVEEMKQSIISTDPDFWNNIIKADSLKINVNNEEYICYINFFQEGVDDNIVDNIEMGVALITDINVKFSSIEEISDFDNKFNIYLPIYNNYGEIGVGFIPSFVVKYPYTNEPSEKISVDLKISSFQTFEDIKKLDSKFLPIAQEPGTSETTLMSQKAITNLIPKFWYGTEDEYNALDNHDDNTLYFIKE